MTDRIDTIIDIAMTNDRETARRLIANLIPSRRHGTIKTQDGKTISLFVCTEDMINLYGSALRSQQV